MTFITTELLYEGELVTRRVLFDLSEDVLFDKMNRFIYGKAGKDQFLSKTENEPALLKPTDIRDHLATDFIDMDRGKRGKNLLRLKVFANGEDLNETNRKF